MQSKRNYGVDALRSVLMIMIIIGHLFAHTEIRGVLPYLSAKWNFTWLTQAVTVCAVDCFIIITGYFMTQSKYDLYKLVRLWSKVIFYSVTVSLILIAAGISKLNAASLLDAFFPVFRREYWFFTIYILLYLLIPFLNAGINIMPKNMHRILVVIILVFFYVEPLLSVVFIQYDLTEGFSIIAFVTLYVIGSYLARCEDIKKKYCIVALIGSTSLMYVSKVALQFIGNRKGWSFGTGLLYHNNSVFVLINAVALFMLFKQVKIDQRLHKIVAWVSPSVFAVYLLHEKSGMRTVLWNERLVVFLKESSFPVYVITVFGIPILIFSVGILIDKFLGVVLFRKIDRSRTTEKIREWCNRYNNQISN